MYSFTSTTYVFNVMFCFGIISKKKKLDQFTNNTVQIKQSVMLNSRLFDNQSNLDISDWINN